MKKIKYPLVGMVLIMLVLSTMGSLGSTIVDNKNAEIFWRNPVSMGPILEVTTDKTVYSVGEPVTTFLTNVGDETLSGGGPIITIYDEEDEIVYQEATYCWHELDPGEYIEWPPWDQTNQQGQQVPVGEYVVEGFLSGGGVGYVDDATFYISNSSRDDELDQYQTEPNHAWPVGACPWWQPPNVNHSIAQSFIPTKNVLTRVQILIGKNRTATYPYVLAIREELTGDDIAITSVDAEDIANETYNWTEFDFADVLVTTGQTYYIISYTANVTDNWYGWAANISNPYPNGTMAVSIDDGETWEENDTFDMCFKTYGIDNQPPTAPTIDGQTSGKIGKEYEYTITGSDPDGDELYVIIDWGDNTSSGLLGPYDGIYEITMKHAWEKKGTYTVKAAARDPFGWGPEGTLEVTMPKKHPKLFSPMPHFGLSIVFFTGIANVHEYNDTVPKDITVHPQRNKIRWFCLEKPWFSSAGSGYVVSLHNYRGVVRPQPIVESGNISFLFVVARDIVTALP